MKKSLGQNFLIDKNIIKKIIGVANLSRDDLVIEIGPGQGALTEGLVDSAGEVVVVEIDKDLIPNLESKFGHHTNFTIINNDILKIDLRKLIEKYNKEFGKIVILGNLPYYITSPIIMKILEEKVGADELLFMMQKEVAQRICSPPGSKIYGAISVVVQYYCEVSEIMKVSKEVFIPKPKVESSVVKFVLHKEPPVKLDDEAIFFQVIKAGFSQRRKTLLNTLSTMGIEKSVLKHMLDSIEIDPMRRAETLSLFEFANVANRVAREKYETKT